MARIIVSENVTLDGVVQDPTGEEGTPGGGWFAQVGPADRDAFGKAALDEALAADAFLVGRRTYGFLASRWPARTGALADRLNDIPKHVVSTTLREPTWTNTAVIRRDVVEQVASLKQRIDGAIVVPASFELVRTLLEHDLVDELTLTVYPVVVGAGERLLDRITGRVSLQLLDNRTLGDHLTRATYRIVRAVDRPT